MKRKRSRVWKVLSALAMIPALLFLFVQTPPGKALLADGLSAGLSSDSLTVRIGRISGWIPGKVTVEKIEVGDAEGIWITGRELHCRWMIRELFEERFRFRELSADEIIWHRLPKPGQKKAPARKPGKGFKLLEVGLDGLTINSLKLEKGVAGMPLEYAVHSGGIKYLTTGHLEGELTVSGDAEGVVGLEAALTGAETDQLKVTAGLEEMARPTFGLDFLSGQGEAVINADGVTALLALELVHAGEEGSLSTRLRFQDRKLNLQQVQYTSPDYSLLGDVSLSFSAGAVGVAVNSTFIDRQARRFDLRGTAQVSTGSKQWGVELEELEIRGWDSVSLSLAGTLNAEEVKLAGSLEEMDFGQLPFAGSSNFTGRVNGSFSVTGPLAQPAAAAELSVSGLTSVQDALDELPEVDFRVHGGMAGGRLFAETSVTNYAQGRLAADFSMPCAFSLHPLKYRPEPEKADGGFSADLDLGIFNQLAFFQNQLVRGRLLADVRYEDRRPSGFLKLTDGRYEHFDLGVVVRECNVELAAADKGFKFVDAYAAGSGGGTVSLQGGFSRAGLDMQLDFYNAWIVQRDEIDAQLSGRLNVDGRFSRPQISGALTVNRADILLDNMVRPPPPVLTDFDRTASEDPEDAEPAAKAPPAGLDIRLELPDQVFVSASMIEAVLGGSLHITDAPRGVSVSGIIEPRRGFVSFIGKKFRFTEGEIVLDGSVPAAVSLDNLTAEYSRSDVTASLILNGPANDPRFQLESSPSMPEDEILSHVLFNRDTSSISPWQAVQIASAARQLSGGLNGPGFMYQVRQAIGIDTLEWREAEAAGEASSVAAGKYLTSGLYIEVNQTLDSQSQMGLTAEFEVTRQLSVETYTGPQMRPGIGLNWRNDY